MSEAFEHLLQCESFTKRKGFAFKTFVKLEKKKKEGMKNTELENIFLSPIIEASTELAE